MNTKQTQKLPPEQNKPIQAFLTEINDDVAAQLSGGTWQFVPSSGPYKFKLVFVED